MNRVFKSSTFWTAVVGSIFTVATFKLTESEGLSYFVGGMFFGRIVKDGAGEFVKAKQGIVYDAQEGKEVKIK